MRTFLFITAVLALLFAGLNTQPFFRLLEAAAGLADVHITGLDGRFPDRLTAAGVTVSDASGAWLEVTDLALDWSPTALLRGTVVAERLTAGRVAITRFPQSQPGSETPSSPMALPAITVAHVAVSALVLPDDLPATALEGSVRLDANSVDARLAVTAADARGLGPASLDGTLAGPRATAALSARLQAAGTTVVALGTLDLNTLAARLNLTTDAVAAAGASAERISLDVTAQPAAAHMHATITGLRLPGDRPELLGPAPVTIDASYGPDISPEISIDISAAHAVLSLRGKPPGPAIAADWRLEVPDLAAFAPQLDGRATLAGTLSGSVDNLAVRSTLDANLASGPVTGAINLQGLPASPSADVDLRGAWNGMDAALQASATRATDGVIHATIAQASVQEMQAQGAFTFDPAIGWPSGAATVTAGKLPAPATSGSFSGKIDFAADHTTTLTAEGAGLAFPGAAVSRLGLSAVVSDPTGAPRVKATLTAAGLRAGGLTETLKLDAEGPANAVALRLAATGTVATQAAGVLDVPGRRLSLASAQASTQVAGQNQTLRLAAPVRIDFATGVAVDRLRLALGAATLDIAGRLAPGLDLTASLRGLPASLARLADPALEMEGMLQADATLRGPTDRPTGTVRVNATNLKLKSAGFVPPTSITGTAALNGATARIDAVVKAGPTSLTVTGAAPLVPGGMFDLRVTGQASLALLDPFLAPAGRQARGMVALDGSLTGVEPRPAGRLTLRAGSYTDAGQGIRITDIAASLHADPGRLVLDSLTARAGGPITAEGSLELDGDRTLSARLTARDITPLSTDALSVLLSADLTATGALETAIAAGGTVRVTRADIRIPEKLPANLPNLDLRRPGPPPPPPPPERPIALDLTLIAPSDIHVRGRGIDAELAGRLHIGGTVGAPKPDGGFTLRRGQLGLAGQTLNFTTGRVSFDGHLPIDPTLDFVANGQGTNVIATLTVSGTASHPRIALSSVPDLPQDEVLAQLLFRRSASSLGPVQIAQIATGLAQITDIGGSGAFDPLGLVRSKLGLDVLSVNGGGQGGRSIVEAGRNVGRGIYIGAKQSTAGVGTQATVRLDLARGLRLEADLGQPPPAAATTTPGAPATGNQIGITYEFEY